MLKWPAKAQRAVAAFFVKWNDIDVFVEDSAKYAGTVYTAYIQRILETRCKVGKVFPLGDREKVIQAAQADVKLGGRGRIYLIDGDLDLIAGISPPAATRLYCHDVYHLENYFVCEAALLSVLHEENPRLSIDEIKMQLDYAGWLQEIKPLLYLFSVFGLTRILDPSLPTIKLGIGAFVSDRKIDEAKIRTFCEARVSALEAAIDPPLVAQAKGAVDAATKSHPHVIDLISAREYLLPTLRWWIADRKLQLPAGKESLLFRLSKASSLERHAKLVAAICQCATGQVS